MYCIYVFGKGYVCKYKNGDFSYSDYSPYVMDRDLAYEIAEGINKRSGLEVVIKELTEKDDYIFHSTKLTLKDLKKGDIFQYINNPNSIFTVISDSEVISVHTVNNGNSVGTICKKDWSMNAEVKKVKL